MCDKTWLLIGFLRNQVFFPEEISFSPWGDSDSYVTKGPHVYAGVIQDTLRLDVPGKTLQGLWI